MVEYAECAFRKVRDGRFYEMKYLIDAQAVQRQLVACHQSRLRRPGVVSGW